MRTAQLAKRRLSLRCHCRVVGEGVERNKQIAIADSQLNHGIFLPLQPAFDPGTARQPCKDQAGSSRPFLGNKRTGLTFEQHILKMDQ